MKEKVSVVLKLMEMLGITFEDLKTYSKIDTFIETGKFPLELYFNDGTRSFDVEHCNSRQRLPIGVIIDDTIYALAYNMELGTNIQHISNICYSAFPSPFDGKVPTKEQVLKLVENWEAYNQISVFLKYDTFSRKRELLVDHPDNSYDKLYCYDMDCEEFRFTLGYADLLPVTKLPD